MTMDLLDPALTAAWRRGSARRRAALRAELARERGIDPRTVRVVQRGRALAVTTRPVPEQLDLPF